MDYRGGMICGERRLAGVMVLVLAAVLPRAGLAEDAAAVIEAARMSASLQQSDLNGSIRKDRTKTPLAMFLRGRDIQFQYQTGGKWQAFHMRLKDESCDLLEIVEGKTRVFAAKKLVQQDRKSVV